MDYLSARFAKIDDAAAELGTQLVALVGEKQVAKKTNAPPVQAQAQPKSQAQPQIQIAGTSDTKPAAAATTTAQPPTQAVVVEGNAESAGPAEGADADVTGRPSVENATTSSSASPANDAAGEAESGDAAKVNQL